MKNSKGLTPKQAKFVEEYLISGNATDAAKKAGYSHKTADQIGSELLQKTLVAEAVQAGWDKRKAKFEISEEKILQELAAIAFFDLRDVMKPDKSGVALMPWESISKNASRAIASVTESETEFGCSRGIRAHDKISALKALGNHVGMWKDGVRPGTDSNPLDVINARLRERMAKRTK